MAIVELSIVPLGVGAGVSSFVAGAIEVLQKTGLKHELTAMGTIVSGDLDDILAVIRKMHESCFDAGAVRVLTQIRIDDRRDRETSMERKIRSVREKLDPDRTAGG
ncbi:MAG: MTH1187 family thiamine-binding protein [Syntrophobacteraceae bacterium]|nr:MTH1187 family thiamine-binding protein [Syntrophobacteraceae bacterium]